MNISTIQELKQELNELPHKKLVELCLSLARYKKDNKEYLSFELFNAGDRDGYIKQLKTEIDEQFEEIQKLNNLYFIKKALRKVLRMLNKYCKYLDAKSDTAELFIYFCRKIKETKTPVHKNALLRNLWTGLVKKINSSINSLEGDLQADYQRELDRVLEMV
jgi:hypothetical protein